MSDTRSPIMQFFAWVTGRTPVAETAKAVSKESKTQQATQAYLAPAVGEHSFKAPLNGTMIPLEEVPDPAFAQRLVGDGMAILPSNSVLTAPCDAEVVTVTDTAHAINLSTPQGAELLIHIGIDTVSMNGKGFTALVQAGQKVAAGEPLIKFDLALIQAEAPSSITMMLITNSDSVKTLNIAQGNVSANQDEVMTLDWQTKTEEVTDESSAGEEKTLQLQIPNPQGWHARPAAQLGILVRQYQAKVSVWKQDKQACATSVVQLMALNTHCGDLIELRAQGPQADEVLSAAADAIAAGLGDEIQAGSNTAQIDWEQEPPLLATAQLEGAILKGVRAAPGLGWGQAQVLTEVLEPDTTPASNKTSEQARFQAALDSAKAGLQTLIKQSEEAGEIFAAQLGLLSDPELLPECLALIDKTHNAEQALFSVLGKQIKILSQLDNPLLAGRAADLRDIRQRVLRALRGEPQDMASLPTGCVVVVDELVPSLAAGLDPEHIQAVIASHGGAFSHGAIIARAKGIPAVFALGDRCHTIQNGTMLLVRADDAYVELEPTQDRLQALQAERQQQLLVKQEAKQFAHENALTQDGVEIEIAANIANEADAIQAVTLGADGVGLLRSEFLFLDRPGAPDEEEQYQCYCSIIKALAGRPLIIRTLDVGGDKPLAYLPLPAEENPFLGERGIRVGIKRPALLRQQLRALIRANEVGPVKIMLPMITTLEEYRIVRQFAQSIADDLNLPLCPLGIMVEVPAAALQAEAFAKEADFFSIGSNDLSQYVTAVDRGHSSLDYLADPFNPAILRLIAETAQAGKNNQTWVGICGGLAGDPEATPLLIGMGLSELSVSAPVVAEIKQRVRQLDTQKCQQLVEQCLQAGTASEVRILLSNFA